MIQVVVDGSAALALVLPDEAEMVSAFSRAFSRGANFTAPAHWGLEVTNGILMAERRKRISEADALAALNFLRHLRVTLDEETHSRVFAETSGLARRYDLTSYDAAYLELAMRRRAALATLDKALLKAAVTVGVAVL